MTDTPAHTPLPTVAEQFAMLADNVWRQPKGRKLDTAIAHLGLFALKEQAAIRAAISQAGGASE